MTESRSPTSHSAVVLLAAGAIVASGMVLKSAPVPSATGASISPGKVSGPIVPAPSDQLAPPAANGHLKVPVAPPAEAEMPQFASGEWVALFDGKTLDGWKTAAFGGEGDVMVEEGAIVMTQGNDMTGVTSTRKDLPTSNYEFEWEGKRVQGNDFFCGLTFPVKSSPCSLILGGWGGAVCGLSSIDGFDASENSTSTTKDFEKDRWYKFRLQVTDAMVTAWIDGEELLQQELEGRRISIRSEVDLSRPVGFSTWRTTGAVRNVRMRQIDPKTAAKKS